MKHTKIFGISLVAMFVLSAFLMATPFVMAKDQTGNGAPSGPHFNLNIIATNDKNIDPDDYANLGHRIFVSPDRITMIQLIQTEQFMVIDYDGTDGKAKLGLIDPWAGVQFNQTLGNVDSDDAVYKIFVRVLGSPKNNPWLNITSGYYDAQTNTTWWSLEEVHLERHKGQSTFSDETIKLTTIYADVNGDGTPERYGLFDTMFEEFFWEYDNHGVKLCQMRFYMNPVE